LTSRELNDKLQGYTNGDKANAKETNVLQHILEVALHTKKKKK